MKSPFRSIRQKLFNEGKLLRYLGYAIGEIALIIIGILFALKINNWNEDNKAQVEFDQYLSQLKIDVSRAITVNQDIADYMLEEAQSSFAIIEFLEGADRSEAALNDFERNLNGLGRYRKIQVHLGLLGELLNGNTDIVSRDPELYQISLDAVDKLLRLENLVETVSRNLDHIRVQHDAYFSGRHQIFPEMEVSYNLNTLEQSDDFNRLVRSTAKRQANAYNVTDVLVRNLTTFLTQLEEYE